MYAIRPHDGLWLIPCEGIKGASDYALMDPNNDIISDSCDDEGIVSRHHD